MYLDISDNVKSSLLKHETGFYKYKDSGKRIFSSCSKGFTMPLAVLTVLKIITNPEIRNTITIIRHIVLNTSLYSLDKTKILGVAGIDLDLSILDNMMKGYTLGKTGYYVLYVLAASISLYQLLVVTSHSPALVLKPPDSHNWLAS